MGMLRHKFFHRAKKVPVTEQELKAKLKRKLEKEKKPDAEKRGKKGEEDKAEEAESSHTEGNKKDDKQPGTTDDKENKKRKTKIRLEMHLDQEFVDGLDAYVWIYDPIPVYYWFFGTLLVLGAIAVCLFPLWPPSVRKGVYYLSVLAAGFLIFIIALAILRVVVFCLLWVVTLGKHHLWLFPNLTEDVGFLASFWPIYQYEYKGNDLKEGKNSKKKKKDKDSDNEEDNQDTERDEADTNEDDSPAKPEEIAEETGLLAEREAENSESESESSQKSQTGKDFEMVERDEMVSHTKLHDLCNLPKTTIELVCSLHCATSRYTKQHMGSSPPIGSWQTDCLELRPSASLLWPHPLDPLYGTAAPAGTMPDTLTSHGHHLA
uniref:Translocation protein SEC62 n=1 Tax=Timema californicum TaxID=61474 RepID=A0A7R9IUW9_TIMCA|nr:unnamed protein product [Timema californicum]